MRKVLFIVMMLCIGQLVFAQEATKEDKDAQKGEKYRRSSLCLLMIDEAKLPKRDTIKKAFLDLPMPDKYNDHNVAVRIFCTDSMSITPEAEKAFEGAVKAGLLGESIAKKENAGEESEEAAPKKKGGFGKMMGQLGKSVVSEATGGLVDTTKKSDYAVKTYSFLQNQQLARQMFDKWFRDGSGNFSMNLVQERGLYDASVLDVAQAKASSRGMGLLADAGEELVQKTFVVVTRFNYLSKDELVAEIDAMSQIVAQQVNGYMAMGAKAATMALKASLGAGYYVKTTSYLFQLNWNDSIANTFYSQLWNNPEAYAQSDLFSVKYIGEETAWANVKAGIFTDKSEPELIRIATVNAMDAVLAKLEKKYEVFKTKTPLLVREGDNGLELTAKIGMKEGLEAGDKFEVLEKVVDEKTQRTKYRRKGVLKVSKEQIWDNRFMADEAMAAEGKKQEVECTRFEGKGNYYNGMLLRQIK